MLKQIDRIRCANPNSGVHHYYTSAVLREDLQGDINYPFFPSDARRVRLNQTCNAFDGVEPPTALELASASILELQPVKNIIFRRREVVVFLEGAFDWTKDLHVQIIGILLAAIYSGKEVEIQDSTGFTPSQTVFVPAGALAEAVACLVIA
jgi:hypothetical protein